MIVGLLIVGSAGAQYFPDDMGYELEHKDSIATKRELRTRFFEKRELLVI